MRVLVTGGSGNLGTVLRAIRPKWVYPFSWQFNILNPILDWKPDVIVHAAAYTDVLAAENGGADEAWMTNVNGTRCVARLGIPLVYISTEYVFDGETGNYAEDAPQRPGTWYGKTKSAGEVVARQAPQSLIIRTLFKPEPFPHGRSCTDQWTSGDTVSTIAPLVAKCVDQFWLDRTPAHDSIHIGTGRKTTFDIAVKSRPDVQPCLRADLPLPLPKDTSLNCGKFKALFGE